MDKKLLKAKIWAAGERQADLAKALDLTPTRFSAKMTGYKNGDFSVKEILTIRDRYKLTNEELLEIFFNE